MRLLLFPFQAVCSPLIYAVVVVFLAMVLRTMSAASLCRVTDLDTAKVTEALIITIQTTAHETF